MRLRQDLTSSQRSRAIDLAEQAIAIPKFKLDHGTYTVTGAPVLIDGLAGSVTGPPTALLIAALLAMAAALTLALPVELRLFLLFLALAATGLTFGALSIAGAGLTVAAIAVLPVLIGLAADYAIQLQWRVDGEIQHGESPEHAVELSRPDRPAHSGRGGGIN